MLIDDFSIETVEVGGYPIQTFQKRYRNLWTMFAESTTVFKDEIYLIEGPQRISFGQAAEMAADLATHIRKTAGAGPGDNIGILMENSIRFCVSFWTIQYLGATAVIFNTRLASPEVKRQLQFSDLKVLLLSPVMSARIKDIPADDLSFLQIVLRGDWTQDLSKTGSLRPADGISEDDTALILFTSGTAGIPKGVMLTHRNLITCAFRSGAVTAIAKGIAKTLSRDTVPETDTTEGKFILIVAPLFHIMAIEQLVAGVFLGRGSILLSAFDATEVKDLIEQGAVYGLTGTPTMYWLLLNKTDLGRMTVPGIRRLGFGAAPMPPDLIRDLRRVFPSARLRNGYGMTEAPSISALPDLYIEGHPTSVGKPSLCVEVKVVDPVDREELKRNAVGELAVRGACVTKGYYKTPDETAKVYDGGWFYTGDMAFRDQEGFIYLVGRSREMINRGGENVYPVEVENVLHLHPKVLNIAVFGLPDPVMGSVVACAIVPKPGEKRITLEEIKDYCREQLASYKIPQKVFFLPELPTNPGGKVMKNQLVKKFTGA